MHRVWCFSWALLLSLLAFPLCHAKQTAYYNDEKFNNGRYGSYPKRTFKTSNLQPPRPNIMRNFTDCDDGSYIFVAPRGHTAKATFFILDHNLELVWGPDHRYGKVYNFQVQTFKGEPYLFFWAGDDSVGGHGEGKYYMLNQHYQEHKKISAGDGLRGDLHSFFITTDDHAVYTGYELQQADLTSVGRGKESWIWEGMFQELDIETGKVIFEWRASEHFPFNEVYVKPNAASKNRPWDWFHINMVDKDKLGNYLVSTRYGRCALYISKDTGEVLWQLGGMNNSFTDLSDGKATTFLGQHDIHWDGEDAITMFDNRADWYNKLDDESIGHRIKVDLKKMNAKLEQSFYHPKHILSTSQGSLQTLPNKHVLMGYGYNGLFTEYDAKGNVMCDATFLPLNRVGSGDVQNYRALKFNWTGMPLSVPELVHEHDTLYMSWLGATKVRSWSIEDSDMADEGYEEAQLIKKDGFETEFVLTDGPPMRKYVRVVAVDEHGKHLSTSRPVDLIDPHEIWGENAVNMDRPSISHTTGDGEIEVHEPDTDFDGGGKPGVVVDNEDEQEDYHETSVYGDEPEPSEYDEPSNSEPAQPLPPSPTPTPEIDEVVKDPWTYVPDHPDLPSESEIPVTRPSQVPPQQKVEEIIPEPKVDHSGSASKPPTSSSPEITHADDVTDDQVLLVLGLVFGVGAALFIRLFFWRRPSGNTTYRSSFFWNRMRQQVPGGGKMSYAYGELPTSER